MIAYSEMSADEHLLWHGSPNAYRRSRRYFPLAWIGVPWIGFALLWLWKGYEIFSSGVGLGLVGCLCGFPMLLVGILMLLSPWLAGRAAKRTLYVVSDRRILVIVDNKIRSIQIFQPEDIRHLVSVERQDGSGDLLFAKPSSSATAAGSSTSMGFYGIRDVCYVEELVRDNLLHRSSLAA
jgi:hypothetical protein